MGGTFDPIHYGHLFIAEEARVRCRLDEIVFIPNHKPAHRDGKSAVAEPATRSEIVQLAIADNPCFRLSRVELDRPGPSFAIDTINALRAECGAPAELFFIMGADSILDIPTWHRSAELFKRCRFIATTRPGFELEKAKQRLTKEQLERVEFLDVPALDIASRDIRRRVAEGLPIRYLVPDVVEAEIRKRGLYR